MPGSAFLIPACDKGENTTRVETPEGLRMSDMPRVSNAFQVFMQEAPAHQQAWLGAVQKIGAASALDAKTEALVYVGILAAARLSGGLPFHVVQARESGATRDEIISTVLAGLPAVGNVVIEALPVALDAYDHQ